ncbi:uncharacterized protein LOC126681244 isoform X1 [Mercurialis annua]|uniref:uncharacterized protein LOC126681244 isoform X1 n=1 Tax=Mercurialis annua TaxID=3986 RepID=UPI00215FD114|nr:uncharacterized protein LOC126681244 isoform X1 [Mercurialis annua]
MESPGKRAGSPKRSGSPISEHQRRRKDDERDLDRDSEYSNRHPDRYSSRSSSTRHDEYSRRDEERRRDSRFAGYSDIVRDESRDNLRNARGKYGSSWHGSKDYRASKHNSQDNDRDRYRRDRDVRDEKRDYHRSSGDHKSYRNRDSYENNQRELKDTDKEKDRYDRVSQGDKSISGSGNQESVPKRPKLFTSDWDVQHSKDANETLKQVDEVVPAQQFHATNSEAANDLNSAKVAAMKAAELVNINLGGVGFMSTEQKKKLLWGSKKSTSSEVSARQWDTALFDDNERRDKFNKLMSLRLHWCLWPNVGCEGRREGRSEIQHRRWRWSSSSREAKGSPVGFREAVHCWSSTERWPHCRIRPLIVFLRLLCTRTTMFSNILLYPYAINMILMAFRPSECNLQFVTDHLTLLQIGHRYWVCEKPTNQIDNFDLVWFDIFLIWLLIWFDFGKK